ncbi:MAG: PAS domain S-box protein [Candidatus Zixiibacteriota bacterium]|nr:MAG: PAS domain S-box protein [candidate division Zixibacteria bacterium]
MTTNRKDNKPQTRTVRAAKGKPVRQQRRGKGWREDELRLTQLSVDRAAESIFWIGPDARFLYVNDTACKALGYTRKEMLSMRVFDIDPNFDPSNWAAHWEKTRNRKPFKIESQYRAKNGTLIPVEISVSFMEFNDKEYHCAHARDISERSLVENALRESDEKFRLVCEHGLLAFVIIQDDVIKFANQAAAELTGYSIDEMLNWDRNEFGKTIHPDDRAFVLEQAEKKQRGDEDVINHYMYRAVTKSGQQKWVDIYSKSVTFEGRYADFVSLFDITERKEAEDVLKKAHHELEFLVEERTVELSESNRQLKRRIFDLYTIFELSRNFNAVLNYETLLDSFVLTSLGQMSAAKAAFYLPREIGGKDFHLARVKGSPPFPQKEILIDPVSEFGKYITAYNRPVFISEIAGKLLALDELGFAKYFPDGLVVPLIFQTKLKGVLVISQKESGQQYQDEDIEFLSILANQTAVSIENARLYESEKEALDKLQKTQKLLLQSERLAVLGELSAKIAHEVNNPLGIIKNYLHLLSRQADSNNRSSEYVSVVQQEIDRIAMIVRQLLDIGRPKRIKFSRTNLITILNEILSLMNRQLQKGCITPHLDIKEPVPEIMAWTDGLKQIFINLLMNARDAMNSGGEVHIQVAATDHVVRIIFQDTGEGIEAKHIPHIFEPFYSTKEGDSGTGLGLSVCQTIVKSHNGTIEFENTEKGGRFKIELPIEQEKEEYGWQI